MIVLDTTVPIYAVGGEHPLREPCRRLFEAIGTGRLSATTTAEVLQEFAYVYGRRRGRAEASERVSELLASFRPLMVVQDADLRSGLELWQRHERLGCFDAILAAATRRSAWTLVSADKAFGRVRDLDVVVPDHNGVGALIAG